MVNLVLPTQILNQVFSMAQPTRENSQKFRLRPRLVGSESQLYHVAANAYQIVRNKIRIIESKVAGDGHQRPSPALSCYRKQKLIVALQLPCCEPSSGLPWLPGRRTGKEQASGPLGWFCLPWSHRIPCSCMKQELQTPRPSIIPGYPLPNCGSEQGQQSKLLAPSPPYFQTVVPESQGIQLLRVPVYYMCAESMLPRVHICVEYFPVN